MKTIIFLLLPLFSTAQIKTFRSYENSPLAYDWKRGIAPAALSFAGGAMNGRDNASKFCRQGFLIGAGLVIGFSDHRRPGWHYALDLGISTAGFLVGRAVGENVGGL